ncbi:cytochrome b/b6 domain-containing protein [bacterium]|nr:cytochrome b/b6 domain-containing protein [bacterium]
MTHALIIVFALLAITPVFGQGIRLKNSNGDIIDPSKTAQASIKKTCGDCHDVDANARSLHFNTGSFKPDPQTSQCLFCHPIKSHTINAKHITKPSDAVCDSCHPDIAGEVRSSVHGRPNKHHGDHPRCTSCHKGYPHSRGHKMTRSRQLSMCTGCHNDKKLMRHYGVKPNAVSSYECSYHGKALMHDAKMGTATCVDCHDSHHVLSPDAKGSPTSTANVAGTCRKCHPGARFNFAASGANHLQIEIEQSALLRAERQLFHMLTWVVMLGLVAMITLDLRKKVFCRNCCPRSGRLSATLIALSFYSLVTGVLTASLNTRAAKWAWTLWAVLLASAFIAYLIKTRRIPEKRPKRYYERFTLSQRLQHMLLALSFTILVLTGMPLRYADVGWTSHLNSLFSGFEGARIAHRVGAMGLVLVWVWHCIYLLVQWKRTGFSFKSWSMWPTRKDFTDLIVTIRFGLSGNIKRPEYDRFSFREKFDYFAVWWGVPVMIISGLILWFPVQIGNRLPAIAQSVALIAHSDEALLAVLAIVVWHFYNVHLNPDNFPANQAWLTGRLSEAEMEREHQAEKVKIDKKMGLDD